MMGRSPLLAVSAALIAATILLGLAVGAGWTETADWQVSHILSLRIDESDPVFISFMQWASWIGGGTPRWIIVILLCGLVWHWCGPRCAVALAGMSLLSNLASSLLKLAFGRARPDLIDHLDHQTSYSYPSGHATNAAVVYLLLTWLTPPRWRPYAWTLAAAMIILNGFSRIMLGVHWASDIVGGTMLGAAFALLGAWWVRSQKIAA
ncbi:undecaprenyl-diphosphatase [Sphingopyxis sp. YR583]|jgi:membrane-associated phospholipid phosphatase|uniref:phosphatase PAP2 family protein n=1 Tax=Sphingopyxis sp. YR583 TaxID=1881047 RepID=UPI0008A81543|nr:phosphatase PAP2 family protein [Sphingopyxis sp. YR583]SEH18462.1 undecaprenyl-diphosphatase [Sphingopyxis sp. YR583]